MLLKRLVPGTAVLAVTFCLLAGCSSGRVYMATLRDNPDCVAQAGISRVKVNACMDSRGKEDLNSCLSAQRVPQTKIANLNACVDARRRTTIGNLF